MKILDPGHLYQLTGGSTLQFIQRNGELFTMPGTTNEEVLEVLIDRTERLQEKVPCKENEEALDLMRRALAAFNMRRALRMSQDKLGTDEPHVSATVKG